MVFSWLKLAFAQLLKNKKALIIGAFFVVLAGLFPLLTKGSMGVDDALMIVVSTIMILIMYFLGFLLYIAGVIMDLVLGHALSVQNAEVVAQGWAISRDVVNMFFIIFLLVIAFATIFRIEEYQYKALLPKLILGVLLVNFSRTIATIFIEFSNLLTAAFLNFDPSRTSTSVLYALLGVQDITDITTKFDMWGAHDFTMLVSMAGIIFILGLLTLTIGGFAGLLIIRTVGLLVLIVLSPLAFGFGVLPATKKLADMWWEKFTTYILYTPLCAFTLYLALLVASQMSAGKDSGGAFIGISQQGGDCAQGAEYCAAVKYAAGQSALPIGFGSPESFYGFALVIGLLMFSFMMIQEQGGALAGFLIGAAKLGTLGLGAWLGKGALKRFDRDFLATAGKGKLATGFKKAVRSIGNRIRVPEGQPGWGDRAAGGLDKWLFGAMNVVSPHVIKEAWVKRQGIIDSRAYGENVGKAMDVMNRIPFLATRDRLPWAEITRSDAVEEEMHHFKAMNPANSYEIYVKEFLDAVDRDDSSDKIEALWNLLAQEDNANEFYQRMIQDKRWKDPKFQGKFFSSNWMTENQDMLGRGEMTHDAIDTQIPMLRHIFGDERSKVITQRLAGMDLARGKRTGGYVGAVEVDFSKDKPELRFRTKEEMAAEQAGQGAKLTADKFNGQIRFAFVRTASKYTDPAHPEIGTEEMSVDIDEGFKEQMRNYTASGDVIKRVPRSMGDLTRQRILDIEDKFRDHLTVINNEAAAEEAAGNAKRAAKLRENANSWRNWLDSVKNFTPSPSGGD